MKGNGNWYSCMDCHMTYTAMKEKDEKRCPSCKGKVIVVSQPRNEECVNCSHSHYNKTHDNGKIEVKRLTVNVSIKDMDLFNALVDILKDICNDSRIGVTVKKEYCNRLQTAMDKGVGGEQISDAFMTETERPLICAKIS